MAYGNRVKETSSTTGTGNITTAGAVTGFVTFNTSFGLNRPFHYFILHDTGNTWETGIGLFSGDRPPINGGGALYRVSSGKGPWWRNDVASSNAPTALRYREEIEAFVMRYNRPLEVSGS